MFPNGQYQNSFFILRIGNANPADWSAKWDELGVGFQHFVTSILLTISVSRLFKPQHCTNNILYVTVKSTKTKPKNVFSIGSRMAKRDTVNKNKQNNQSH